jgi:hypothetical protein
MYDISTMAVHIHNPHREIRDRKKADWYLVRNLAMTLPEDKAIKLLFVAKGDGHEEGDYMVEDKANICVGCGTPNSLTLHHIGKCL